MKQFGPPLRQIVDALQQVMRSTTQKSLRFLHLKFIILVKLRLFGRGAASVYR